MKREVASRLKYNGDDWNGVFRRILNQPNILKNKVVDVKETTDDNMTKAKAQNDQGWPTRDRKSPS